jgi:hypothetical protein
MRAPTFQAADLELISVAAFRSETATAHLFPIDRPPRAVAADGDLDLSDVLPGFRFPLRRFFE